LQKVCAQMALDISATIKKHPYAIGGLSLAGLIVLYVLLRSSGGTVQQSSDAQSLQTIAAANAQQSQLAAQVSAQQAQLSSQNYQTNLAATVQNNQTLAAQQSQQYQTDAALIAALASNQTSQQTTAANLKAYDLQTQLAEQGNMLEAGVMNNTTNANLTAAENTNATNLAAYNSQVGYATTLAKIQGALTSLGITTSATTQQQANQEQYTYATTANQNQFDLNNQIVGLVGQAGLNHGTASLESSLTGILAGVENQPAIGVAAVNAGANETAANDSMWSNITNAIAKVGTTVASGLVGAPGAAGLLG
jgi:hypothetical protein